ncbi:MAG TPA: type VI secretion system ATPase TssH, partial [Tenuifilaceae bacterium]|nr:type VI secretion system ATPase TssH [Tenuifilaceae bacterium]
SHIIQSNLENTTNGVSHQVMDRTRAQVLELLRSTIRPEFLNRVDEIIMFSPLTKSEIREIVNMQFQIIRKMLEEQGITLSITESAIDWIVATGFDPLYGARPIKRLMQRHILNRLSKEILAGKVSKEKPIVIDHFDGDELVFR